MKPLLIILLHASFILYLLSSFASATDKEWRRPIVSRLSVPHVSIADGSDDQEEFTESGLYARNLCDEIDSQDEDLLPFILMSLVAVFKCMFPILFSVN